MGAVHIDNELMQSGIDQRYLSVAVRALSYGVQADYRIGLQVLEHREVVLVFAERLAQREVRGAGREVQVQVAVGAVPHFALRLQLQGRYPQVQRMDAGAHLLRGGLLQRGVGIYMNGHFEAAEVLRAQVRAGIGLQLDAAVLCVQTQAFQCQGNGVGRQASGNKEGIHGQLGAGLLQVLRFQLAVQGEPTHGEQAVQRVRRVGENNERTVRKADFPQFDDRQRLGRGILFCGTGVFADREDVPVGRRGVIVVGEDARTGKGEAVDVVGATEQGHVVELHV